MFWFESFNGIRLESGNFSTGIPRAFAQNRMATTGGQGEYDLNGVRNPMTQQTYSHEFTMKSCDFQTRYDQLFGLSNRRGLLVKTNGPESRQCTAKIFNISDATTIADYRSQSQRIGMQFTAEPFWYDTVETSVNFAGASYVSLRNTPNRGNARAIKYLVLTIYSNIDSSLTISITPNNPGLYGAYYGTFKYGTRRYSSGLLTGQVASGITYNAPMYGTLVIDAGNDRVTVNNVDAYANTVRPATQMALLWLEPGDNIIRFSAPATGNVTFRSAWI